MSYLLRLLLGLLLFLQLRADGEPGDEGGGEGEGGDEGEGEGEETTLDDFMDDAERGLGGKAKPKGDEEESPAEKRAREADERAEAAERRASDAERRAADAQRAAAPAARDPEYEREEARLAAARAKNEDTTWLQWQIDIERRNRGVLLEVSRERALAADSRDAAQFERVEQTHPKLFSKYKDRVEQWRTESMKNGGAPAPRLAILDLLIGNDMRSGKLKVKTKKAPPADVERRRVDRGATPGARSDVDAKTRKSDSEKRRERLRNLHI